MTLTDTLIAGTRFSIAENRTANGWKIIVTDYDTLTTVMEDGFVSQAHAQAQADREVEKMRYGTSAVLRQAGAA